MLNAENCPAPDVCKKTNCGEFAIIEFPDTFTPQQDFHAKKRQADCGLPRMEPFSIKN
jgi:hypothetical protein